MSVLYRLLLSHKWIKRHWDPSTYTTIHITLYTSLHKSSLMVRPAVSDPPLTPPLSSPGVFCTHITESQLISSSKKHHTENVRYLGGCILSTDLSQWCCVCVLERKEGISSCSSPKLFPTKCKWYSTFFTFVCVCFLQFSLSSVYKSRVSTKS